MSYSKNILLTGAGFTKNFDGFLAEEMWAQILIHTEVQKHYKLIKFMKNEFNYEKVYYEIMHGKTGLSTTEYKNAIHDAIMQAYENLDYRIRNNNLGTHEAVFQLIKIFYGNGAESGLFFTLNQDLYIERLFKFKAVEDIILPGIDQKLYMLAGHVHINDPKYNHVRLKETVSFELSREKLNYIKLHGSCNWKSYDGTDAMVIGLNKKEYIGREPLLREYYRIFEDALSQDGVNLLVIGYGFGDDHINEIIHESFKKSDKNENRLKLYVLSPESPEESKVKETKMFEVLAGYFQCSLSDLRTDNIYPESNLYFKRIKEIFS